MGAVLLWRRIRKEMRVWWEESLRINRGKKRDRVIFLAAIFQSYRLGMLALKVLAINKEHI